MRIEFLGTGGYHPNDRRQTACVMLPEIGLLFDAGTSVFRVPEKLETKDIHIFLSHAHLDHVVGLTYLLGPILDNTIERACVHGTEKTLNAVQEQLFFEALFPVRPDYEYIPIAQETSVPGDGTMRYVPLKHPGGSIGYRLDFPDRSLAYITDTIADDSYRDFIQGVDLLIHECYFPDEMADLADKTGHSYTTPVARLAEEVQAKRLLLVHIDPLRADDDPIDLDKARAIFPETEIAEDGLCIEL